MDSYPSSQTSKFVDLLNSQQSISFGNYEDSVSQASSQAVGTKDGGDTGTQRRERRRWTPADDIVLISVWLNTSKYVVVRNEQKSSTFWSRVAAYYSASRQDGEGQRGVLHCKQRWHKINDLVCKFCGAYEAASREKTNGQNENDVLKLAHQILYTNHKKKFFLEYAWKELRNDQKCSQPTDMKRPEGVKASKARGKKPVAEEKAMKEFETMWSIRQHDLAQKEHLSKMRLLDSLTAKKEPLVEYEEELKKKLINELLLS
uniref:Myb-like domain-containing protein n=2 Tax=Brassica TaxID=3705 RepID=A0A0D3CLL6_BRAOL